MLTRRQFVKTASMVSVMPLVGLSKEKPAKKPEPCDLCQFVKDTIANSGILKTYQHVFVFRLMDNMILVQVYCRFGPSVYNPHLIFYYRIPIYPVPTES